MKQLKAKVRNSRWSIFHRTDDLGRIMYKSRERHILEFIRRKLVIAILFIYKLQRGENLTMKISRVIRKTDENTILYWI